MPKPVLNAGVAALSRVRLVDATGADHGVMSGSAAYQQAQHRGLDVLQVARGEVPVVKLLDYDAQPSPKALAKAKPPRQPKLKQVRLSPATDTGDLAIKVRQCRQFLLGGHCVRLFMQFRRGHGRLRDNAITTLCDIAATLVPAVAKLRKGEPASLRATFVEPPTPTPDTGARMHKPLEVFFEPLGKAQREKLQRLEEEQ